MAFYIASSMMNNESSLHQSMFREKVVSGRASKNWGNKEKKKKNPSVTVTSILGLYHNWLSFSLVVEDMIIIPNFSFSTMLFYNWILVHLQPKRVRALVSWFQVRLGVFLFKVFLIEMLSLEMFLGESSIECFFKKHYINLSIF